MRNPFVYVGVDSSTTIRCFELDLATGALMARGSTTSGANPHYLAFHPSGKYLYALSEVAAGRIHAFSVNVETGALSPLNDVGSGGSGPAHIGMHRSGKFLLSSNYGSGHAAALPIMEDGRLGAPVSPRVAGTFAHMILDDGQSGKFVFVPSKGDNRILQYKLDEATGALEPNSPPSVAQEGAPRHMTFHRSGRFAFLLTESGKSVVSYKYDSATGLLTDGVRVDAAPSGNGAHILVHPTKDFLYASIRAFHSIAVFTVNAEGRVGAPTQVQTQVNQPWDFDIEPSGQYLVVGNHGSDNLRVFRINQQTGLLTLAGSGAGGFKPRTVGILRR
jgi:6-phosphogluconolactonase